MSHVQWESQMEKQQKALAAQDAAEREQAVKTWAQKLSSLAAMVRTRAVCSPKYGVSDPDRAGKSPARTGEGSHSSADIPGHGLRGTFQAPGIFRNPDQAQRRLYLA